MNAAQRIEVIVFPKLRILERRKESKPRGRCTLKNMFKRKCLKENGYTFDL